MAMVVKIILTVLAAGCVVGQNTTESAIDLQAQPQHETSEKQLQDLAEKLNRLLTYQKQQLSKLNELETILANRLARCSIEVLAYGANNNCTPKYGYVKLNTAPVWQASWCGKFKNLRGVNVVVVDPFKCSVRETRSFDTYGDSSAANQLRDYLQQVNRGSIIVGVSADEASHLLASALQTLRDLGADVADVQRRGSFGFVAQKGFPAKTALRKVLTETESYMNPPHFKVTVVNGCSTDELSITIV